MTEKIALFPGSFDPITKGHQSIILRALPLFSKLIIAIGVNSEKKYYFPIEKRIEWLNKVFENESKIEVRKYSGLTVDFCKEMNAKYIVRGLRTSADFEFERTIGIMNKNINHEIETIFLLADSNYSAINSSIVREIHKNNGDITQFVPDTINIM